MAPRAPAPGSEPGVAETCVHLPGVSSEDGLYEVFYHLTEYSGYASLIILPVILAHCCTTIKKVNI